MARKTPTLKLRYMEILTKDGKHFLVEKITDSIDYLPGQYLHENEVRTLCASDRWKVTIEAAEK